MSPARGMTNGRRFNRRPQSLPRIKVPVYDPAELAASIRKAADFDADGWAHAGQVAHELGVSRSTAYRYLCDAASRGWIESQERYRWRYTKSVLSRQWRGRRMMVFADAESPGDSNTSDLGGNT